MAEQVQYDGVADGYEVERAYSAAARDYFERTKKFIERPAEEMKAASPSERASSLQSRRTTHDERDGLY